MLYLRSWGWLLVAFWSLAHALDGDSGAALTGVSNLLLTPHIAGITEEANQRVSLLTAQNVLKHLR